MTQARKYTSAQHRQRRELVNILKSQGWVPGFIQSKAPVFGLVWVGLHAVVCARTGGGVKISNVHPYLIRRMKRWPPLADMEVYCATIQLSFPDGRPPTSDLSAHDDRFCLAVS